MKAAYGGRRKIPTEGDNLTRFCAMNRAPWKSREKHRPGERPIPVSIEMAALALTGSFTYDFRNAYHSRTVVIVKNKKGFGFVMKGAKGWYQSFDLAAPNLLLLFMYCPLCTTSQNTSK